MIQEIQLRVDPRTAASMGEIARVLAKRHDIAPDAIQGIRILKRSIDARQRQVVVNLKVRVYIDEPMTDDYLVPPIDYKPVDSKQQAVVVGMGPGGLFAALRLIELGINPIVLERGKDVMSRASSARASLTLRATTASARVGREPTATANSTPAARNAARWNASWAYSSSMVPARTSSSMPIRTSAATSCRR